MLRKVLFTVALTGFVLAYLYNPFRIGGKSPVVQTTFGKVVGSISSSRTGKHYYGYLGIPYARPPVGEKRFESPEPPSRWEGVRETTSYGSKCLQLEMLSNKLSGSEDCLFLNIFVPKEKHDDLPVMVYIHGGAFVSGSANMYGSKYFMDEQVVLVTLNYRLNGLGFLNTGDSVVKGNMGLKDQLMALTWIKDNIESFGGDPKRITLFGESAGAASVHFHVLSPRSKGLFSKAIVQSGSPLSTWALYPNPKKQSQRFAAKFGCPIDNSKEMVACLKKVDAVEFVSAHIEMSVPLRDAITLFVPTIEAHIDENTFLGEDPRVLLEEGRFNKMPMIAGVNSEEGLFTSAVVTANQTKMDQANEKWTWWSSKILAIPENEKTAQLIRKFYFGNNKNIASKAFLTNYTNMFSDRFFLAAFHQHAKLYSNHAPLRLYYYTHRGDFCLGNILASSQGRFPFVVNVVLDIFWRWFRQTVLNENIEHMGAAHADEIPLLFDFIFGYGINTGHRDFELSASMVKLWVSFATNKESEALTYRQIKWMPVNSGDAKFSYLQIDTQPEIVVDPFADRVNFWESLAIPS